MPLTLSNEPTANDQITPRTRRFTQISLGVLLCLVTIFGLGISHYLTTAKYNRVRNEITTVKKDFRIIEVTDPTLVHAVKVPSILTSAYQFRLYLPPGKKYNLYYAVDGIPETGIPSAGNRGIIVLPTEFYHATNNKMIAIQMAETLVYIRT